MSGLADILLDNGFEVSGSDRAASALTDSLINKGAKVYIGQKADNITEDIDVFVYTAAIHPDHPEFAKATALNLPILTRAELLGQIMANYKLPIAISGTHGKTTVTGMVSEILMAADTDPTLSVGGILESIGGNIRIGHSDVFVTEACEYTNSFLSFFPKISVILNVEEDHLDFFKDIHDIRNSFNKFANHTPEDGVVIIGDVEGKDIITKGVKSPVVTFGSSENANYYPTDIKFDNGNTSYTLHSKNHSDTSVSLIVPGMHSVLNSMAAIAVADFMGIDRDVTLKALKTFGGAKRRFEKKGVYNDIIIYDDYAHHPSEIKATLSAAANISKKKLWCVFQPHTYTRTKALMDDFASALALADAVILAPIYAARETDNLGISSNDVSEKIKKLGTESYYLTDFEEIKKFIKNNCAPGDMLITMGAGDIVNIADDLTKK